jgi:hypothetical protein
MRCQVGWLSVSAGHLPRGHDSLATVVFALRTHSHFAHRQNLPILATQGMACLQDRQIRRLASMISSGARSMCNTALAIPRVPFVIFFMHSHMLYTFVYLYGHGGFAAPCP